VHLPHVGKAIKLSTLRPRIALIQRIGILEMDSSQATSQKQQCASVIVIPARLASTRLPEKLLLRETGKSVLQHTYEAALTAKRPSKVIVAVDHERLLAEVTRFGGHATMTDPNAASGTDRITEVARALNFEIFVNVQGDEPEIAGSAIDQVIELLEHNPDAAVATLATPIRNRQNLDDPACVKVVCSHDGNALYFSRSVIPHPRDWHDDFLSAVPPLFLQHLGIYAYRRDFLLQLKNLLPSPLESTEKLEQLRFLQNGFKIQVGIVEHSTRGIDTLADYQAFVRRSKKC
jgi:3-deoxy-manno-octulosonate cytidylyltransferase (CMP-KDO synthetase)